TTLLQAVTDLTMEVRALRTQERTFYHARIQELIQRELNKKESAHATLDAVVAIYQVSLKHLRGYSMRAEIVNARHAAFVLLRDLHGLNFSEIGRRLNKTHGAVSEALLHWPARCQHFPDCQRRF